MKNAILHKKCVSTFLLKNENQFSGSLSLNNVGFQIHFTYHDHHEHHDHDGHDDHHEHHDHLDHRDHHDHHDHLDHTHHDDHHDHDDQDEHDDHDGNGGHGDDKEVWARHASLPKNTLLMKKFLKTFTLRDLDLYKVFWARSGLKID